MTSKALNPQIIELLAELQQREIPPIQNLTPTEAREIRNPILADFGGPKAEVAGVENRTIPGPDGPVPVRIYSPKGNGPFPILLFFHGGGWVVGSLDTHDCACRLLSTGAHCLLVAVDYPLAPENKFPAAIEDAYAALEWVSENGGTLNGDPRNIAVAGDSAGGNIATILCQMSRDRQGPEIKYQILIYPVTDLSSTHTESYDKHGEGYMLTKEGMIYFINHYLDREENKNHPYASPLLAENLSNLPPALIIVAEFDVLRDEGLAYADRLKKAGISVTCLLYDDMIHAFLNLSGVLDRTREAIEDMCGKLQKVFRS